MQLPCLAFDWGQKSVCVCPRLAFDGGQNLQCNCPRLAFKEAMKKIVRERLRVYAFGAIGAGLEVNTLASATVYGDVPCCWILSSYRIQHPANNEFQQTNNRFSATPSSNCSTVD